MIAITDISGYSNVDVAQTDNAIVIPTQTQIQNLIGSNEFINATITTAFKNLLIRISIESVQMPGTIYIQPQNILYKVSEMFKAVGFYIDNGTMNFQQSTNALDIGTAMIIDSLHDYENFQDIAYKAFHDNTWMQEANDVRGMDNTGLQKLYYISVYNNSNLEDGESPQNAKNLLNKKNAETKRFLKINLDENSNPKMPAVRIFNNSDVSLKLRLKIKYEKYVDESGYDEGGFGPPVPYDIDGDGTIESSENIYLNRHFLNYFPNQMNADDIENEIYTVIISAQQFWDINYDARIRGGEATIEFIPDPGSVSSWNDGDHHYFKFYIRGINPTYQQVTNYLNQENYLNEFWFLIKQIRQESGSFGNEFKQFNPKEEFDYLIRKIAFRGLPNMGPPKGYGLTQIDNIGGVSETQVPNPPSPGYTIEIDINENGTMVTRTIDHFRDMVVTDQEVWHWKKNIDRGVWFLGAEKMDITKAKIDDIRNEVINWNNNHPNDLVVVPSPVQYNTVAYAWIPTGITELIPYNDLFDEGNPPLFTNPNNLDIKSFFDAVLLKSYNGNSGGYFMDLDFEPGTNKPIIEINEINTSGRNYVEEVSNRDD